MSITDSTARLALRDGNTPMQFREAAQRHANAFWFFALVGTAVWYFISLVWGLLPLALAAYSAVQSVGATLTARRMEFLIDTGRPQGEMASVLPARVDLDNPGHVALIDDIRVMYGMALADEGGAYAGCMFRPASLLPYPKETIRGALRALLDYAEGERDSHILDASVRDPGFVEAIRVSLLRLDDYLDVPPAALPTEPRENARIGFGLQASDGAAS